MFKVRFFSIFFLSAIICTIFCSSNFCEAQSTPVRNLSVTTNSKDVLEATASGVAWLPRQIINGTLYGVEKTAVFLSDPDFVERVRDILYIKDPELLWYPVIDYNSGFRPSYGAGLLYRDASWQAFLRGDLYDNDLWSLDTGVRYRVSLQESEFVVGLAGLMEQRDDFKYAGLGADPQHDGRNLFRSDTEYGTFSQDKRQLRWHAGIDDWRDFSFFYQGMLTRRSFQDHGDGDNDLREVFHTTNIPGFTAGAPIEFNYHELSVEYDSRMTDRLIQPGFRSELYSGFAIGLGGQQANLWRIGGDVQGFIPLGHEDRLLIPRVVMDVVESVNDDPIPFSEYPRQYTFRGLSDRRWARSEEISTVSSLEYAWRLSQMLSAHLFCDYLVVGSEISSLEWKEGLWAAGVGLHLNIQEQELGRMEIAGGSEGIRFQVSVGAPVEKNRREKW